MDFRPSGSVPHGEEPTPATGGAAPEASTRLDSWKEIGAYLKRDVRTLRRWEKNEGLPVHRHVHAKQATVYAYRGELDAWWNNRRPKLEVKGAEEARERRKRWVVAGVVAAVAVAAGVGLWLWLGQGPALPFSERDWVLIATFENRTGEPVLDGTLEYALERELSNSHFVNVVPRERVEDALRLMRKPSDTPIDAELGREVCLRDGAIRALLTGRVEKLDETYVLSATLVEPTGGVSVASFSEQAVGQKEIVPALRRLSHRVRETLGEKLSTIQQSDQKLAKVTTPSLRALQLYTQADAAIAQGNSAAAEELLKQAVTEDPEFASGYMHLAHVIRIQGKPESEWRPHAERAVELSENVTDRERYFIQGRYYHLTGQPVKAIAHYEALLRLYPDHFWATNNLRHIYFRELGRPQEATEYSVRLVRLRPNDFQINYWAGYNLARWGNERAQAQPYLQHARELASPETEKLHPFAVIELQLFPAYEHWLKGDVEQALAVVNRVAESLNTRSGRVRDVFAGRVGRRYFMLGKLEATQEVFQIPLASAGRTYWSAILAFARVDKPALRHHLSEYSGAGVKPFRGGVVIQMARMGLLAQAQKALSAMEDENGNWGWEPKPWREATRNVVGGELALARGQTEEAIPLLEDGVRRLRLSGDATFFHGSESLANIWEQQGNFWNAIQVLETARQQKVQAVYRSGYCVLFWMRNQVRLAQLYRQVGREEEAREIEAELRKLLAYADADHAILRQLQGQQATARTQSPN